MPLSGHAALIEVSSYLDEQSFDFFSQSPKEDDTYQRHDRKQETTQNSEGLCIPRRQHSHIISN